jgi:hypothetical protein
MITTATRDDLRNPNYRVAASVKLRHGQMTIHMLVGITLSTLTRALDDRLEFCNQHNIRPGEEAFVFGPSGLNHRHIYWRADKPYVGTPPYDRRDPYWNNLETARHYFGQMKSCLERDALGEYITMVDAKCQAWRRIITKELVFAMRKRDVQKN